jgi:hypothetical protein
MSYLDLKKRMKERGQGYTPDYMKCYLTSRPELARESLDGKCFTHLFHDVLNRDSGINLKAWMGPRYWEDANDLAADCILIVLRARNLIGRQVKGWTSAALKAFDVMLVHYIQEVLKQQIPTRKTQQGEQLFERDTYYVLNGLGGREGNLGRHFNNVYTKRNAMEHIQYREKDGQRHFTRFSAKTYDEIRDYVILELQRALEEMVTLMNDEDTITKGRKGPR